MGDLITLRINGDDICDINFIPPSGHIITLSDYLIEERQRFVGTSISGELVVYKAQSFIGRDGCITIVDLKRGGHEQ